MNEIEALKEELKQTQLAYQMAIQWSQFKAGFLARISHELRSPLSSLIGLHQLILSDLCESPEEQREFLSQAHQSALKLMRLIDEVVDIAKTSYGTKKLDVESVPLAEIFNDVESLTYLQAANRNLKLQIVPPDSSVRILVDRARTIQLLAILIDGGIDSLKEGKIQMTAHPSADSSFIDICIDIESSPQVWSDPTDLLQNNSSSPTDKIPESTPHSAFSPGMKLMLAQTLIETMEGRLTVVDLTQSSTSKPLTRLQCSIPVGSGKAFDRSAN
jgi:K+-sensing histidine kinase KdpD